MVYVILNFVIPYTSLFIGTSFVMPRLGKFVWLKAIEEEYGPDWIAVLYDNEKPGSTEESAEPHSEV